MPPGVEQRFSAVLPADVAAALVRAGSTPSPFRERRLEETMAAALPLVAVAGLTRVADITGLDAVGLPVVSAIRPNARSLSVSSGKGESLEAAWVSGIIEALELAHAEHFRSDTRIGDLDGSVIVPDLASLPLARDRPSEPTITPQLLMACGQDLVSGAAAAVPLDLVHAVLKPDWPTTGSGFLISTNGLAGGNSRQEAILHGLCEVVERDALALLHASDPAHSFATTAMVDWESVEDPTCLSLVQRCQGAGLEVLAFDITSDLAVPAFFCRLIDRGAAAMGSADGAGCHPSPVIALRRAVSEAAQTRLLLISGARDDIRGHSYAATGPRGPAPHRRARFAGEAGWHRAAGAVDWVIERTVEAGFDQIIAVDLACQSDALAFVRIVVPGLEGSIHSTQYSRGRRATQAIV